MDHLFDLPTAEKLVLLTKEGLIDYLQHYSCSLAHLRKQMLEVQKENEKLRAELGYGQTIAMRFPDEDCRRQRRGKKSAG